MHRFGAPHPALRAAFSRKREKGNSDPARPAFAELAATTNFSFLRGASHPEEMVARAAELGLAGLGVADRNTLAGVVRAHVFARENRAAIGAMRVIAGARLVFRDEAPELVVYPETAPAMAGSAGCSRRGNLRAPKGECHLDFADALEDTRDLRVIAMPGGGRGEREKLLELREAFGARLWIGASLIYGEAMRGALARRVKLAREIRAPLIATNDALMHVPERRPLADVVACIREGVTLEAAGRLTQANAERHLKDPHEMARLFAEAPEAVERDAAISSRRQLQPRRTRATAIPRSCAKVFRARRPRSKPSPGKARSARFPDGVPERVAEALGHELDLDRPAQLRALFPHRARHRALCAFARHSLPGPGLGRQFDASASASASPRSIPRASICCSSVSSPPNATNRPTSTSISSTSGATR